jgi:hypothetical protein
VAEGARLESVYTFTGIGGSNPSLSASINPGADAEAAGNQATPLVIAISIAQAGNCCCFPRTTMTTCPSAFFC